MVCPKDCFRNKCTSGPDDLSPSGTADEVESGARKGIEVDTFHGTPDGLDVVDITEVKGSIGIAELPCPCGSINEDSTVDIGCIK